MNTPREFGEQMVRAERKEYRRIQRQWPTTHYPLRSTTVAALSTRPTCQNVTSTRNSSSSKRTPPNPETLLQPPSIWSAKRTGQNAIDMTIERSNSMVIVDEITHDRRRDIVTILVGALSCLSVVTALVAMYSEASAAAYVAFTFPLFVAPYVLHQRAQVNQLPTLRTAIKKCHCQVSRIMAENVQLNESIARLSAQLKKLAFVDDRLSDVAKAMNISHVDIHQRQSPAANHQSFTSP
jgi:hypothetical protein